MREMLVVPYDESWAEMYEAEKEILLKVFGGFALDIRHFGSTSVKGMSAKPVLDIMIIVTNINLADDYKAEMIRRGYTPKGENGIEQRRYFVRYKPDGENHASHIHVYEKGNPHISDELMFRDFLSLDEESFREYERVKLEAAEKFRFSPGEYTDAKSACVAAIMEKARKYYHIS